MGIVEKIQLLLSLVPKIEKIIVDAKAAEQTPQMQALIADLESAVLEAKGAYLA